MQITEKIPSYVPTHLHEKYRKVVLEHEVERKASSYWLSEEWLADFKESKKRDPIEFAMKLSAVRQGIKNFIHIMTGKNIPVTFSSGQISYATANEAIVLSASSDPDRIDSTVGTAMHEAAHLILSQKTQEDESIPLYEWLNFMQNGFLTLPADLMVEAERIGRTKKVRDDLKMVLNVMEDRRIDAWVYDKIPGYRDYYDARYAHRLKSPLYAKGLVYPDGRRPLFKCFELHFIGMVNPLFSPDLLHGMEEIVEIVDLPNIRRYANDPNWIVIDAGQRNANRPQMIVDMIRILTLMYTYSINPKDMEKRTQQSNPDEPAPVVDLSTEKTDIPEDDEDEDERLVMQHEDPPETEQDSEGEGESEGVDEDNLDPPVSPSDGEDEDADKDEGEDADEEKDEIDELLKMGEDEKKENLDAGMERQMAMIDDSRAELTNATDKNGNALTPVVVFHRMSHLLMASDSFTLGTANVDDVSQSAVTRGIQMGNAMASKIKVIAEESNVRYNRLRSGRLDGRRLAHAGYGAEDIFNQSFTERHDPIFVHLSIDASGSMRGKNWANALAFAAALGAAATKIATLDVVISARGGASIPQVAIVFDSRKDKIDHILRFFPFLTPMSATPEGLCIEAIKSEMMLAAPKSRKFFINISDGVPEFNCGEMYYGGDLAIEHTARQVREIEKSGIAVMSYFIGSARADMGTMQQDMFTRMYGKHSQFIDPESVPAIIRTLNQLFME